MEDQKPKGIFASIKHHAEQVYQPPALASVLIDYPKTQVRMSFNAHCTQGEEDVTKLWEPMELFVREALDSMIRGNGYSPQRRLGHSPSKRLVV